MRGELSHIYRYQKNALSPTPILHTSDFLGTLFNALLSLRNQRYSTEQNRKLTSQVEHTFAYLDVSYCSSLDAIFSTVRYSIHTSCQRYPIPSIRPLIAPRCYIHLRWCFHFQQSQSVILEFFIFQSYWV